MSSADFDRAAYHAAAARGERVSFHSLMDFAENGKKYNARCIGALPQKKDTAAMFFGRAAHKLILEGRAAFNEEHLVTDGPINEKTNKPYGRETKAWGEWLAKQDPHKADNIISTQDTALILLMDKAVRNHEVAARLLSQGNAETPLYFDWCGLPCQSCLDWVNPVYENGNRVAIVDLKTTDNLSRFFDQAHKLRYVEQLAFYRRAYLANNLGENVDCYIIGVEKDDEMPRCGVWHIPTVDLDQAEDEWIMPELNLLAEAREMNEWRDGYEALRTLTLHNY